LESRPLALDPPEFANHRRGQGVGLTTGHDRRPWTEQERGTLDRLLGKVWPGTIAKRLKRTETSVV